MILQQVAEVVRGAIRSEDAVARYGGEEFVVILTESDRKGALRMAERVRRAVEQTAFGGDDPPLRVTVSLGSATFPEDGDQPWLLIEHADRALYAAKDEGRNRAVAFHTIAASKTAS
jgi:diguanylate cyclase (GGDEF)-like protein